jgi:antitoxin MazE
MNARQAFFISVIPIGDSKGIRIPDNVLNELKIGNELEMNVYNDEIVLKRIKKTPREGWEKAFKEMNNFGDDNLLFPETSDDSFQWEWWRITRR